MANSLWHIQWRIQNFIMGGGRSRGRGLSPEKIWIFTWKWWVLVHFRITFYVYAKICQANGGRPPPAPWIRHWAYCVVRLCEKLTLRQNLKRKEKLIRHIRFYENWLQKCLHYFHTYFTILALRFSAVLIRKPRLYTETTNILIRPRGLLLLSIVSV